MVMVYVISNGPLSNSDITYGSSCGSCGCYWPLSTNSSVNIGITLCAFHAVFKVAIFGVLMVANLKPELASDFLEQIC